MEYRTIKNQPAICVLYNTEGIDGYSDVQINNRHFDINNASYPSTYEVYKYSRLTYFNDDCFDSVYEFVAEVDAPVIVDVVKGSGYIYKVSTDREDDYFIVDSHTYKYPIITGGKVQKYRRK